MSGATRRRVVISSDEEDDDPVDSHDLLSDDGEAEESVVQDSLPPTPTSRSFAPDLRMSSTPKSTNRSSLMDEVENSPAKSLDGMSYRDGDDRSIRSESGNSVDSDHERSRSFLGSPVVESPISARLAAKEDVASKQALRERLLRKQHEKHRAAEGKSQSMRGARRSLNQPFKKDPMDSATVEDEDSSQYDTPDSSPNDEGDTPDAVMSKDSPAKTTPDFSGITSLSSLLSPSCFNPRFTTPRKSLAAIPSDDEDDFQIGDHNAKKRQTLSGGADSPINISDSDGEEEGNTAHNQTVEIEDTDEEEKEDKESVEGEDGLEDEHGHDVDSEGEALVASNGMHPSTLPTLTDRDADIDKKEKELERALTLLSKTGSKLPDGGDKIRKKIEELTDDIETLRAIAPARRVPVPPPKPKLAVIQPPHLTMNQYSNLISNKTKNLFGGKMTDERVNTISRVTEDLLVGLHKEMTTMPDGEETATPKGMTVELMGHQKKGLTWMLWREGQRSPGGILADDMGLGKTISLISLLMAKRNARKDGEKAKTEDEEEKKQPGEWEKRKTAAINANLLPSNATLVIVPASVVYQWKKELEDRVEPGLLNILVFHGPKREKQARRVVRHDVVITTYETVRSEMTVKVDLTNDSDTEEEDDQASRRGKKKESTKVRSDKNSVLTAIAWERVILDEAHNIKNRNSLVSRAVCKIPATYRWCLTGTPVHNNLYDLFSLIRFLRVRPFDEVQAWMGYIMANNRGAADRLNTLTKSLLLRRTKEMVDSSTGKPIVALKQKLFETHELEFTGLEKSIYDHMMKVSRQKVLKLMENMDGASDGFLRRRKKELGAGEKLANPFLGGPREVSTTDKFRAMSSVLTLLLRLRQAAVHLALTRDALDLEAFEGLATGDGAEEQALAAAVADITLDEDAETAEEVGASAEEVEKVFKKKFKSAKIVALLDLLDEVLKSGDKCVIVSQWTSLLDLVEYHIYKRQVEYTSIDGTVPMTDRQERVNSFNRTDGGTQVMLLSLRAGGVGLNLVGGNHLFLLDLHWNPALELQACDRIYRMGQTKNVYIHKLVMKGTIEAQVLALQESKMSLAKSVLEGAAKKLNKLTMNDLKFLFQLDDKSKIAAGDAAAPSTSSAPPARR